MPPWKLDSQKPKQLGTLYKGNSWEFNPKNKTKKKSLPHLSTKFPALGVAERTNATGFGTLHCALLNCHTHFCLHFSISWIKKDKSCVQTKDADMSEEGTQGPHCTETVGPYPNISKNCERLCSFFSQKEVSSVCSPEKRSWKVHVWKKSLRWLDS